MDGLPGATTPRCPTCGYERSEWTRGDATRTLVHAEALITEWSGGATAFPATAIGARARAVVDEVAGTDDLDDRVHVLWHGLAEIAERRRQGEPARPRQGRVVQLNRSAGGVPKTPVAAVDIGWRGVVGDRQATRVHHGRPWQALCLWSADVIGALVAEGHPLAAGAAGENVTISGIDWSLLRGGTIVDIGAVRCQLSAPTTPCRKIRRWFRDGAVDRIDHDRHPGWSRWYASVLRPGSVAAGDPVTVGPLPA